MKKFKIIVLTIPFLMSSCASTKYLEDYESIKVFLTQEKIDSSKVYLLQEEKVDNKKVLADFKEYKSAGPYFDPDFKPIVFHNDEEYKKMSSIYLNDTLKRYWRKDDFLGFNFKLEERTNNTNTSINEYSSSQCKVYISEPMYYWKRKYLIFTYDIYTNDGGMTQLVFMKKEKGKWKVDRISSTDVFF